jgi:IS1 family transposase
MVKFGIRNGVQRFRCRVCRRTLSDAPENPLVNLRVPFEKAVQVVSLLCESTGIRACERLTGLNRRTVLNILKVAGQKAADFMDEKIQNVRAEWVQSDEINSFVYCKQRNADENDTERGDQYTFLSVDRRSKLIINWLVGKRTRENADIFMRDLRRRVPIRFNLTTDGWRIYSGYDGAVLSAMGTDIDYATETKRFAPKETFLPRRLIGIKKRSWIGNPDMKMATTCHAERTNLSVRLFTRRFTRCTLGYSKLLDHHKLAVALFIWHFNFARKHGAYGVTPAYAAGIAGKEPMKIEDLFNRKASESSTN